MKIPATSHHEEIPLPTSEKPRDRIINDIDANATMLVTNAKTAYILIVRPAPERGEGEAINMLVHLSDGRVVSTDYEEIWSIIHSLTLARQRVKRLAN